MSSNPYKAPTTNLEVVEPVDVPTEILKRIKGGWLAGLVSAGVTSIFVLVFFFGSSILGINAWSLIDVAVMLGLSYGVFRKSRTCAILLLALFILNRVLMWMEAGSPTGLVITLVFLWLFIQGVIGTFQFHRWKNEQAQIG